MNSIKQMFYICFGLLIFSSCEDVIVLDLEEAETRIVIEGTIEMDAAEAQVWITKTNSFYETGGNEVVANAQVRLINPLGDVFTLAQAADGAYRYSDLAVSPGEKYTLEITTDGLVYTAMAEVPYPVVLDSLSQEEINFPLGGDSDKVFQVFANWTDTPNQINYYRLKAFVDGEVLPNFYTLLNDELGEGNKLTIPMRERFDEGALVRIELRSVDQAYFDYFQKLSTIVEQGPNGSNPFNPKGNFDQEVLGYFGIFDSSSLEIQL